MSRSRRSRGAGLVLLVGLLLPLVFLGAAFIVDYSRLLLIRQSLQRYGDEAARLAQRYAPDVGAAQSAAQGYVAAVAPTAALGAVTLDVASSRASVSLSQRTELPFLAIATSLMSGDSSAAREVIVSVTSEARGRPFDVVVGLDLSGYLAPTISSATSPCTLGTGFSDPHLPPIDLISQAQFRCGGVALPTAHLTARCFNRPLLALKRAAIATYESFAQFGINTVGAVVGPVGAQSHHWVRFPGEQGRFSEPPQAEGRGTEYRDSFGDDRWCGALADEATLFGNIPEYSFPLLGPQIGGEGRRTEVVGASARYAGPLAVGDVIWSQVVRDHARLDGIDLLTEMVARLLAREENQWRGTLQRDAASVALLILGDVPWEDGTRFGSNGDLVGQRLSALLAATRTAVEEHGITMRLVIAVGAHQAVTDESFSGGGFETRLANLGELLRREQSASGPRPAGRGRLVNHLVSQAIDDAAGTQEFLRQVIAITRLQDELFLVGR